MTTNKPTISLVIPAYNEEKRLGDCLTQALKNSHGRFSQIIVVDSGSTDTTRAVAERFPGVTVIRDEKKGPNHARQLGFLAATGELVAFLDADTLLPPGWIRTVDKTFSERPGVVCLSGPYDYYDISRFSRFLSLLYWLLAYPIYLLLGYMAIAGNVVLRRETLQKMGGLDTGISFYGDDTDLARRAHRYGTVVFNLRFRVESSGRRLLKEGIARTGLTYVANFLSVVIFHKPYTKTGTDVR